MTEALPIGVGEFARTEHGIFKDLDDERLRCTCGWASVAGDEEAAEVEASDHVARMSIGSNRGPELDPFGTLKTRAEELLAEAEGSWKGIIEIAGKAQAERADTFLNQCGSFNLKKTDKGLLHKLYDEKEREVAPHRDALTEIKNRYDPVQLTALAAKKIVEDLVRRWQKKQEAALLQAGAPPAVAREGAAVRGEFSTRRRPLPAPDWDVEITDPSLCFLHYQDVLVKNSDFLALLRRLARHEARDTKGTRPIPGCKIIPNESAACVKNA